MQSSTAMQQSCILMAKEIVFRFLMNKEWERRKRCRRRKAKRMRITLQCSLPLPCSRVLLVAKAIVSFQ